MHPLTTQSRAPHTIPTLYAVYLLRSLPTSRTYIGSTPHPLRRLRQHNGLLSAGGARRTLRGRPWEMVCYVEGFPSKISALQFEWAWQHVRESRLLRDGEGQMFKSSTPGLKGKLAQVKVLLCVEPFKSWQLSVRFFNTDAHAIWASGQFGGGGGGGKVAAAFRLGAFCACVLDEAGVIPDPDRRDPRNLPPGLDARGNIDVFDLEQSRQAWSQWNIAKLSMPADCAVCNQPVDTQDMRSFALCPDLKSACTAISHLACLARSFLGAMGPEHSARIMPVSGDCPKCGVHGHWQGLVKAGMRREKILLNGGVLAKESLLDEINSTEGESDDEDEDGDEEDEDEEGEGDNNEDNDEDGEADDEEGIDAPKEILAKSSKVTKASAVKKGKRVK